MKILILITFLSTDTLPSHDSLFQALSNHHAAQTAAQLAEFDNSEKGIWMNYIPSVGVGYTPEGKPRPTTSFSLSQIFNAQNQRRDRAAKRTAILAAAEIELRQLQSQLSARLQEYSLALSALETRKQIHEIDRQLFELAKIQYENAEMSPTEFLPKQKAYLLQQLEIEMKEREVLKLEREIILTAKF